MTVNKEFKYRKGIVALWSIEIAACLHGLAYIIDTNELSITNNLSMFFFLFILVYAVVYHHVLNETIIIGEKLMAINKIIGTSKTIDYSQIRKIILQQNKDKLFSIHDKLLIYSKYGIHKANLNHLEDEALLISELAHKSDQYGFRLFEQEVSIN